MELRTYWQIAARRRHVIVPLVLITFIASAIANLLLPPTYKAETMVMVQAIMPPPLPNPYYSEEYYRTVQSEYATDDLGMIVKSQSFAERVKQQIESRYGQEVAVRDIKDSIANAKKQHRTLKITVAAGNYALTKRVSEAIDEVLTREGGRLVSRAERQLVDVMVIDPPRDPTSPSVLRRLLDVLLHSAVALVVGTGLAFLLHALDDRVQNEADAAETAGWPVMGVIPRGGDPDQGAGTLAWIDGLVRRPRGRSNVRSDSRPSARPVQSAT
ncbi:MAG: YveK family protein [Chloroflexota bacterium]